MRFVQDAIPESDEKGYSQTLVGVDGEWRGIEARALPQEMAMIENRLKPARVVDETVKLVADADDD